ncbi:hypothetical protein [Streptomyces sp. NPDC101178]
MTASTTLSEAAPFMTVSDLNVSDDTVVAVQPTSTILPGHASAGTGVGTP